MADQEQSTTATAGRSMLAGNGKNLTERLAAVGAKPVMAMDDRDRPEMPIAAIVRDWLNSTDEYYRQAEYELTKSWAKKMLEVDEARTSYKRRMLQALVENK